MHLQSYKSEPKLRAMPTEIKQEENLQKAAYEVAMASAVTFCIGLLLVYLPSVHPVPQSSCSTDLMRLVPCLPFVNGAADVPSDTCCANLGSMVHDEPSCLCQALNQSGAAPVAMNMSRVMELPPLCRLDLPAAGGACAGLLPLSPAASPPVNIPRPSANSTAPSMLTPVTPPPPVMTLSPRTTSQLPGLSWGSKLVVDGISVALGFMALVSALAF